MKRSKDGLSQKVLKINLPSLRQRRMTWHKRFALRPHPNSAYGGTSFIRRALYEISNSAF